MIDQLLQIAADIMAGRQVDTGSQSWAVVTSEPPLDPEERDPGTDRKVRVQMAVDGRDILDELVPRSHWENLTRRPKVV